MVIGHAEIVDAHDVLMLQARNDFVFLEEPSNPTNRSDTSGTWLNTLSTTSAPARSLSAR